jgi:hypothetical protein
MSIIAPGIDIVPSFPDDERRSSFRSAAGEVGAAHCTLEALVLAGAGGAERLLYTERMGKMNVLLPVRGEAARRSSSVGSGMGEVGCGDCGWEFGCEGFWAPREGRTSGRSQRSSAGAIPLDK